MIFWDASAILPLLVADSTTSRLQALASRDPDMLVWWGAEVECISALARLERKEALDGKAMTLASGRLKQLARGWHEIEPGEPVRESALRFLRVHPLTPAGALQLAAALAASEHHPGSLQLVTLDERLAAAARKEGFALVDVAGA
jgi:predicted nucleic acid-binding protein